MLQKPLIYVSRITNLSDARYCAGMGVDMIGFVIDPIDADYVSPSLYQEIIGWISGPKKVIQIPEVGHVDFEKIINDYKPDILGVSTTTIMHAYLPALPLILELAISDVGSYKALESKMKSSIDYLLISGIQSNLAATSTLAVEGHPFLLSLDHDQVQVVELGHVGERFAEGGDALFEEQASASLGHGLWLTQVGRGQGSRLGLLGARLGRSVRG